MEKQTIQPFLTVAHYHLIEQQLNKILNAYTTTKDKNVLLAVKGIVETELTKNLNLLPDQLKQIEKIYTITERSQGDLFLESLKPYVIPFKEVTASDLKRLFKKEKKLKLPHLESIDFQHVCYLTWNDVSTHSQYVVLEQHGELEAIKGHVETDTIKGICAICNRHTDVRLFTTTVKGKTAESFKKHSNFICTDEVSCNQHITDTEKLDAFFERITH